MNRMTRFSKSIYQVKPKLLCRLKTIIGLCAVKLALEAFGSLKVQRGRSWLCARLRAAYCMSWLTLSVCAEFRLPLSVRQGYALSLSIQGTRIQEPPQWKLLLIAYCLRLGFVHFGFNLVVIRLKVLVYFVDLLLSHGQKFFQTT